MPESGKPRVLHVLGALDFGGIETWLVHILRHRELSNVQHEILLTKTLVGAYEAEVRALGVPVHRLIMGGDKVAWLTAFRRFLAEKGPFVAVHSHVAFFSTAVLAAAKSANVPVRIAHCHNARTQSRDVRAIRHRLVRALVLPWLRRISTRRIGISAAAIEEIAGTGWRRDPAAQILLYGFDFSRNEGGAERAAALRDRLGIKKGAPIIGHVGRFDPVKNHAFLLDAFAAYHRRAPGAQLVLVGQGDLQNDMRTRAAELGVTENVHFAGTTDDVPAYMAMFDLFVLPSFSEGLGIVCLEAQAAGTRSLVSNVVVEEVDIIPGAIERLPLDAGAEAWAQAMERLLSLPAPDANQWRQAVEDSRFGIRRCVTELNEIYAAWRPAVRA